MGLLDRPSASGEALVLRSWPCGETSAVVSLLTRDHGFVKVIAKAVRRPGSRLRALVEPGRLVSIEFSLDPRRELQYLRGGGVEFDALGEAPTLERSAYLLGALELLDRCRPLSTVPDAEASAGLFEICSAFLRMLDSAACPEPALVFFAFEWELLRRHGVVPVLGQCCGCGAEDSAGATRQRRFSPDEGGVLCGACGRAADGKARLLSEAAWELMAGFDRGGMASVETLAMTPDVRRELGAHLHRFLGFHMPGYRLPAALDLLRAGKDRS